MDGFLVIDKPAGWTSHDVVARVRRLAGQKRVGHTGTLDPDATGVLLVCLGHATRLIEYTSDFTKRYVAGLALGSETDSQDASGAVVATHDSSGVTEAAFRAAAARFVGEIEQVPPMVSAVHHQGERLYDIARRGETVERAARPVTVHRLDVLDFTPGPQATAHISVECSGGTYVRTLCHDIGAALGVGGHMTTLRRTGVGPFSVEDAVSLETLAAPGAVAAHLRPMDALLPVDWPVLDGTPEEVVEIGHGRPIPIANASSNEHAAIRADGRLMAVLRREGEAWRPEKVFPLSPLAGP